MTDKSGAFDETADAGTAKVDREALAPGSQLGKYKLERVLGEGGMGVVWAAQDPDLERAVAIKVLKYAQAAVQLRQRLLREARAMAKLKHPNVLTVYEVGTSGDRDYIAMELVDGQSLDHWFQHATPDERWDAVMAAGRGLAAAHAAGVAHRDFKPHNVLRSRNGRVLVTDFGLARGLVGEDDSPAVGGAKLLPDAALSPFDETETPLEKPARIPKTPSGIDTPLTQTGALIGTPAYMAPEQYLGAPPDARTDQFAFCVTVWQALTGERPFKGQTLDEMRKSANAGVANIPAKMPGAIRAVLARGLDPDAKKRWTSLEELLEALEAARMRPVRWRRIGFAMFGFVMAGVLILAMSRRDAERAATSCDDPDRVFAEAVAPAKNLGTISNAIDDYGKRWIESYRQACKLPKSRTRAARIGCLEGTRDDVAAMALVLHDAPDDQRARFDIASVLPNLKSCEGSSPLVGVIVPRDQPRRANAIKMMASRFALQRVPIEELGPLIEQQYADAKMLAGDEFASSVLVTGGTAYQQVGRYEQARTLYKRFLKLPSPRNARLEAIVRVNLLEASMHELSEPRARVPPDIKDPRAKATLHPELVALLAAARSAAGSDDALLGAIDVLEARAWMHAGQWNRYKTAYSDALESVEKGRRHFEAIGDVRRTAIAFVTQAEIYLARGDDRALDDAQYAARQAAETLERAQLPAMPEIDEIRAHIAFTRRDLNEAHRRYDGNGTFAETTGAPPVRGTVAGAPTDRTVTVFAWLGRIIGDRARVITDIENLTGETLSANPDGFFKIRAREGMLVIAEAKGLRSRPVLVGKDPLTLKLEPTTTISGSLSSPNLNDVQAYARYDIAGSDGLEIRAPVDRDATFDLAGLLPGMTPQLGLVGPAGDGERSIMSPDVKNMYWPSGQAVDVIVRGKGTATPRVYVLRGKNRTPTSVSDFEGTLPATIDVARCDAEPIGANNTDAGREVYRSGDLHCTITGNEDGDISACVVWDDRVKCEPATLTRTVEVSYPDGRYAAGVTPVLVAF